MNVRRFVFNYSPTPPALPGENADLIYLYSSEPVIRLTEIAGEAGRHDRHDSQLERLSKHATIPHASWSEPLGESNDPFKVAYRGYAIERLSGAGETAKAALGSRPPQPVSSQSHAAALADVEPTAEAGDTRRLYLFNVIVALEWIPGRRYLEQLQWCFRRASDLLYDVTDGAMAFGQVVFADHTFLPGADIQIMASDRIMPRSWVGGLVKAEKFMPIRLGRGLWDRRSGATIAWDEPVGYQTIVHEWLHYALFQRDGYLSPPTGRTVTAKDGTGHMHTMVLPQTGDLSSIMSSPQGISELPCDMNARDTESGTFAAYYPEALSPQGPDARLDGPGALPLPLPAFSYAGAIDGEGQGAEEIELHLPEGLTARCAAYVFSAGQKRLIAQGAIGAVAGCDPSQRVFRLLGAKVGDTVALIDPAAGKRRVWQVEISNKFFTLSGAPDERQTAALPAMIPNPLSYPLPSPGNRDAEFRYTLGSVAGTQQGPIADMTLCEDPQGEAGTGISFDIAHPETGEIFTGIQPGTGGWRLDGYLIVRTGDKLENIAPYSQGGGPATTVPVMNNPVTAGAASGEALIFFYQAPQSADAPTAQPQAGEQAAQEGSEPKAAETAPPAKPTLRIVITTLDYAYPPPSGWEAVSPVFGVASNEALDGDHDPTLVIMHAEPDHQTLAIFRLDGTTWTAMPTHATHALTATALAQDEETGGKQIGRALFNIDDGEDRLEYFQLCRMNPAGKASA